MDRAVSPSPRVRSAAPEEVLAEVRPALARDHRVALCQIIRAEGSTPGKAGWRMLVTPDAEPVGNLGGGAFEALVISDARAKLAEVHLPMAGSLAEVKRYYLTEEASRGEATGMVCGGLLEVFLEVLTAAPVLLICGGGPVGQALASAGALAGFELQVADDRPEFQRPELFPEGTQRVEVGTDFAAGLAEALQVLAGRELYIAVVSRCWETDTAAVGAVLQQLPRDQRLATALRYVGLMGSRRKIQHVRQELGEQGLGIESALGDLPFHAPIGLPLGGDTPGEIAISILAQIQGIRHAER